MHQPMMTSADVQELLSVSRTIICRWVKHDLLVPAHRKPRLFPRDRVLGLLPERLQSRPFRLLHPGTAARRLGVDDGTLRRWTLQGLELAIHLPVALGDKRQIHRYAEHELDYIRDIPALQGRMFGLDGLADGAGINLFTLQRWINEGQLPVRTDPAADGLLIWPIDLRNCVFRVRAGLPPPVLAARSI
ncbi:MAG TPA: hypothetical protein VLF67_00985 [Candidatus Saccharimonas sp.]|nr:hypothetical protein [Candidatus Saccharimonas sp.]